MLNLKDLWIKSKKTIIIVGAILSLLAMSYVLGRCSTQKERDNAVSNIIALKDSVHHSVVTIEGLNYDLFEKKALILSQRDALAAGELEKERLKALALKSVITESELTGEIKLLRDSLKIVPGTTIITIKDTSGIHDYIKIPFTLLDENETNLHLLAGMSLNKTAYFSLHVPFTGTMTVGYKKIGLFKTVPVGVFTTTNPYISVNSMDVVIVQEPDKIWNKWYIHCIAGALAIEGVRILLK